MQLIWDQSAHYLSYCLSSLFQNKLLSSLLCFKLFFASHFVKKICSDERENNPHDIKSPLRRTHLLPPGAHTMAFQLSQQISSGCAICYEGRKKWPKKGQKKRNRAKWVAPSDQSLLLRLFFRVFFWVGSNSINKIGFGPKKVQKEAAPAKCWLRVSSKNHPFVSLLFLPLLGWASSGHTMPVSWFPKHELIFDTFIYPKITTGLN